MWKLSIRPSAESALAPVDVVVSASPRARVSDLAATLGEHLSGPGTRTLLAPKSNGRTWAADRALGDCDLRDGDVLDVETVPEQWLSRPVPRSTARAHLQVLDGPDAGLVVPIESDVATIGRSGRCTLRLSDPTVSREHARVLLAASPVVVDQGSAHGTRVAGLRVTTAQPVAWGEHIRVGRTTVTLRPATDPTSARPVGVLRSPRFGPALVATEHDVPAPPSAPRKQPLPWPMMLMPLMMGGAMFATTRNTFSLIFMLGFPIMMLTSHLIQRRSARAEHEAEVAAWREELAALEQLLGEAAATQREQAEEDAPDLDVMVSHAAAKHHGLWNRQEGDDDFLAVRVGRGPRPAVVTGKVSSGGDRVLRAQALETFSRLATLADLPVPLDLASASLAALAGPAADVDELVRALLVRLAVTHSPTDLAVRAVLGPERAHIETWLRWLPHASADASGTGAAAIGAAQGQELLEELASASGGAAHTLCLIDEGAGIPRRTVEAIAGLGDERLHLLWLGADVRTTPAATRYAVDLTARELLTAGRGGVEPLTRIDTLDLASAWKAARQLTAYRDEAAVAAAETLLPASVRLPEVSGDLTDPDDVGSVLERWASSSGLRAQLGAGVDGPVTIDLREDGPHGLVAGTTGSGKSELLQSLIVSLAMNNPPSRITFLLVDYKGGAAFRECADLPHSVGYITDLTPALVQRALVSLHAELTHREHLLAEHGAKDLVALERSHPDIAPPSMLICVDEFAALLAEIPEFVDGMVSIAQRGRSLGMHMLLATQRPAGVVTPQIKANTDLRIALRVASAEDSSDVLDAPDAAQLSRRTPGRAWLRRTGHGTREMVQVAWVGAHEERRDEAAAVRVQPFTALPQDTGVSWEDGAGRRAAPTHDPRTDLERLVATATTAFLRTGAEPPRKPWLPPLPDELALELAADGRVVLAPAGEARDEALVEGTGGPGTHVVRPSDAQVVLGLLDHPARQSQLPWTVDYGRIGHLLVFGASGSGKTELLRTLTAVVSGAGEPGRPGAVVYGIDAGGGGLGVLDALPSVGSIVVEQQIERVLRLLRLMHRTVTERNEAMAARGVADLAGLAAAGVDVQRIHLVIDNLPALLELFEGGGSLRRSHAEKLLTILQEGRRAGVHVTATAPQRTGIPSQLQATFGQRVVLRMTSEDDYAMLGVPGGVLDDQSLPGRGLVGGNEVQVASLGGAGTPEQGARIAALADQIDERYRSAPAMPVPGMPTHVPSDLLPAPVADEVCLGVEDDVVGGVTLHLLDGPLLVAGRARSGRTSLLHGLVQLAARSSRAPRRTVLIGPKAERQADGLGSTTVLSTPEAVQDWLARATAEDRGEDWDLVVVDDMHEWERRWEAAGAERSMIEAFVAALDTLLAARVALVVATDVDDARSRQHVPGLVSAVRRARRAVLLSPELGDGALVGAQVPMSSHEALSGVGRGLFVAQAASHVVHVVSVGGSRHVR